METLKYDELDGRIKNIETIDDVKRLFIDDTSKEGGFVK